MSTALIVFAKAPVAGLAKTRLIPSLGAAGAADLAHRLLVHSLAQAADLQLQHWELCVTPDTHHPAFVHAASQAQGRLKLTIQGDGDLGARMSRAFDRVLANHDKVLLMGTDAPALTTAVLQNAAQALDGLDAVFVPALDGLTRPVPELFLGMTWSTPHVMADTRIRARQAGLRWSELPPVADIDEAPDLVHLPGDWR